MASRTLADIRTGTRYLADMEEDGDFISDTELTKWTNEGISSLYDVKLDADNAKLYAINGPQVVSAGDYSWSLPTNFRRLVSLHVYVGDQYYKATSADPSDYAVLASYPPEEKAPQYFLRKEFGTTTSELYLFPAGQAATSIGYTYIAEPTELSLDTDSFSGTIDELEYIETYAAIKCLLKEESDTSVPYARQEELAARIRNAVKDVDAGANRQVRNLRKRGSSGGNRY